MNEDNKIKFKYVFSDSYNPVYCNGAYGGISSHGEIVANFFLERMPIPKSTTSLLNNDGTLSGDVDTDPEDFARTVIRYVSTGVILSENSARSIYEWLGTQLNELDNRKAMQNPSLEGKKDE